MAFTFSEKSKERMQGVDHRLVRVAERAIQISKVDFGIPEFGGVRTNKEQYQLYKEGKSQIAGRGAKKGKHQLGLALDVFAYVDGKASWETEHLAMVAAAMLQAAAELGVYVQWGGLWTKFVDMPHFQIDG